MDGSRKEYRNQKTKDELRVVGMVEDTSVRVESSQQDYEKKGINLEVVRNITVVRRQKMSWLINKG